MDAAMSGSTIVQVLGPLVLPSLAALRAAFLEVTRLGAHTRIGARADADRRWVYDPAWVEGCIENIVLDAPADVGEDVGRWLSAHRLEGTAIQVAVAGEYLAIAFDHALFDAFVPLRLPHVLIDAAARERFAAIRPYPGHPLLAALRHTHATRPDMWRSLRASARAARALQASDRAAAAADPPASGPPIPAVGGPVMHTHARYDLETSKQILAASAGRKLIGAPMLAVALSAGLVAAGIPVHVRGNLLVDLRRYLPGRAAVMGNFSGVLPLALIGPGSEAEVLSGFVHDALASGHPLASSAMRVLRRSRHGSPSHDGELTTPPTRARVSVSSLGVVRDYERLPWAVEPDGRRVIQSVDSIDVDTIGWMCSRVGGRLHVTASYRADAFATERVEGALALIGADPGGLVGRPG